MKRTTFNTNASDNEKFCELTGDEMAGIQGGVTAGDSRVKYMEIKMKEVMIY